MKLIPAQYYITQELTEEEQVIIGETPIPTVLGSFHTLSDALKTMTDSFWPTLSSLSFFYLELKIPTQQEETGPKTGDKGSVKEGKEGQGTIFRPDPLQKWTTFASDNCLMSTVLLFFFKYFLQLITFNDY